MLGIDIGQNHTKAVLVSEGRLIYELHGPTCFREHGDPREVVFQALADIFAPLMDEVSMVGVGMTGSDLAGYPEAVREYLTHHVTNGPIIIIHDGKTAQLGAFLGEDGLVVIAGTGVVGWGTIDQRDEKVSGHGFLVGDEGSGVWIGKEALRRSLRAQDYMEYQTSLGMLLCQHFAQPTLEDVNRLVRHQPQILATFVPVLVRNRDSIAEEILDQAADHLANTMIGLYRKLDCPENVKTVFTGGIARIENVSRRYKMRLREVIPDVTISSPLADSAIGATFLFRDEAGWITANK